MSHVPTDYLTRAEESPPQADQAGATHKWAEPCTTTAEARTLSSTLSITCYGSGHMQGLKWCPQLVTAFHHWNIDRTLLWWFE